MARKVAVIGAGPSGLVAMKTLLDGGHHIQGFEQNAFVGGMWNYSSHTNSPGEQDGYTDTDRIASGRIYNSLKQLTSSYSSVFSDFIPDDILQNGKYFMTHTEYQKYIHDYANHFKLHQYVKFSTKVLKLNKCKYSSPKCWSVTYRSGNVIEEELFEFVFIASGPCSFPHSPIIPNADTYQGLLVHSSQVREEKPLLKGQSVLVIGGGFSGGDMVTAAVRNEAKSVHWSLTRDLELRNHWCYNRYVNTDDGLLPWDMLTTRARYSRQDRQFWDLLKPILNPLHTVSNSNGPRIPGDAVSVTDTELVQKSFQTKVVTKVAPVAKIINNSKDVLLNEGTTLKGIDVIVVATGFKKQFPFLDDICSVNDQQKCELYNFMISPNPDLDGLGFLTMATGPVSLFIVAEMQARWLCFKLLSKHYSEDGCFHTTEETDMMKENLPSTSSILDPYAYLDGLASDVGCKPPNTDILLSSTDTIYVELAAALLHGPLIGAQYRLVKDGQLCTSNASTQKTIIDVAKTLLGNKFKDLVENLVKNN